MRKQLTTNAIAAIAALFVSATLDESIAGQSQSYYYDPAGRLIVVVDPTAGSATYRYDANGNILSVTRAAPTAVVAAEVSPNFAPVGALVTIAGTGFGTASTTSVSFNGKAAVVSAASPTRLTVTVPAGATSGPITVTAPGGTAKTLYDFTVAQPAPSITSVPSGALTQGSTITLGGTGFDPDPESNVVTINNMRAQVTSASSTALTVVVPTCVGVAPVLVATASGAAASAAAVTILPSGDASKNLTVTNLQTTVTASLGATTKLSFDGSGRAIMATFTATQGQSFIVTFPSADVSVEDSRFAIYSPDNFVFRDTLLDADGVQGFDKAKGNGPYLASRTGVYSIWVQPPKAAGQATLKLIQLPTPATATLSNAKPVSITTTTEGQLLQATFNAVGGSYISLDVANAGSQAIPPHDFGSNGQPDSFLISGPYGAIYSAAMGATASANGFFTGGMQLPGAGTGLYTVTLAPTFPHYGTLNLTMYNVPAPASAVLTANGAAATLTTSAPGQTFAPTFNAAAGDKIALDLQLQGNSLLHWPSMIVSGPAGLLYDSGSTFNNWLAGGEHFTGAITVPAGGTGTYTVAINPVDKEIGTVRLQLTKLPSAATATLQVGGPAQTLTTTLPGQIFQPTFAVQANQRIALLVKVVAGTLGTGRGDAIAITGPNANNSWNGALPQFGNQKQYFSGLRVTPSDGAGTYTVTYTPYGLESGSLSFQVFSVPADVTAILTAAGPPVSLTTTALGQQMRLTFAGQAGQTVALLVNGFTGALAASNDGFLSVFAPDGTRVSYLNCCDGIAFTKNLNLTASGTYTVILEPPTVTTGGATFQLFNSTALTSTLTPGGGSVGVTTTAPNQEVSLTMKVPDPAGRRVAVLTQFDGGLVNSTMYYKIVDPTGNRVFDFAADVASSLWTGALPAPEEGRVTASTPVLATSGDYTVQMSPINFARGSATFTAYDVPADATATLKAGATARLTLTTPGQGLRATFVGAENASATFTVTPENVTPSPVCFDVTVLAPDGQTPINAGQACSGAYSTGSLKLPSSGNYMVVAIPKVPATGTFTVGVTSP